VFCGFAGKAYICGETQTAMDRSAYFFQGFLSVFGLSPYPFYRHFRAREKIDEYWDRVGAYVHKTFFRETGERAE